MNNKIKEILEIQEDSDYKKLSIEDILLLKDHITNLQKTNKNHSKKLIELGDKITNLQEENKRLKQMVDWNDKVANKKQDRIDKALKIINDIFKDEEWYENYEYNDLQYALENVRDVLQGSDKE